MVELLPRWSLILQVLFFKCILSKSFLSHGIETFESFKKSLYKAVNVERCDEEWIPYNLPDLQYNLDKSLFGQPLVKKVVLSALAGHLESISARTISYSGEPPLVMSFHGGTGVGKTFVIDFVTKSLYKKGLNSKYVHSYIGSMHFPLAKNLEQYKDEIHYSIVNSVNKCSKSLYIFDEVHKLHPGILNVITSLIKNARLNQKDYNLSEAIFIFITNSGFQVINDIALELNLQMVNRNEFLLSDFEKPIMEVSSNEGGIKDSDLIENRLISHFVPFLPLEKVHVFRCVERELDKLSSSKNYENYIFPKMDNIIEDVINEAVSFGPPPHSLFSDSGCKRISQKLSMILFSKRHSWENSKLINDDHSHENIKMPFNSPSLDHNRDEL